MDDLVISLGTLTRISHSKSSSKRGLLNTIEGLCIRGLVEPAALSGIQANRIANVNLLSRARHGQRDSTSTVGDYDMICYAGN